MFYAVFARFFAAGPRLFRYIQLIFGAEMAANTTSGSFDSGMLGVPLDPRSPFWRRSHVRAV